MKKILIVCLITVLYFSQSCSFADTNVNATGSSSLYSTYKNENYYKLIAKVLDKKLPVTDRVNACEEIRNLPDTTNLTKVQLYALKIAARYKICNIWTKEKNYLSDKSLIFTAEQKLREAKYFYLEKVQTSYRDTTYRIKNSEENLHNNLFFLGLYEYAIGNKNIGTESANDELSYFQNKNTLKKDYVNYTKIRDLTFSICDENKTADEIVGLIKSISY